MELIFSVKTEKDVIFHKDIKEFEKNKNFKSKIIFTREGGKRIDSDFLKHNLKIDDNTLFYICGPQAMVTDVVNALKELKIKENKIKTERFG